MEDSIIYLIALIIGLCLIVLLIAADWKIFTKAGEKGWKSLIPIYNLCVQCGFSWRAGKVIYMIIFSVLLVIGQNMGEGVLPSILIIVGGIGTIVMSIRMNYYLARSFGHGIGYTIGLEILPSIFTLILAFSSDKYIGNGYDLSKGR